MEQVGSFASADVIALVVLAVVLLGILGLIRVAFKLTATVFKLGCAIVFLIVAGASVFLFLL